MVNEKKPAGLKLSDLSLQAPTPYQHHLHRSATLSITTVILGFLPKTCIFQS